MALNLKITRVLYQKLLGLYPPTFREQFGESMTQTFNDLWHERKNHHPLNQLGFVLWLFGETAGGIVQEHIVSIQTRPMMKNTFPNLRLPALISALLVLPFVLLEFAVVIAKGRTFDFRGLLDSAVIFGMLWLGITAILLILIPLVQALRAGNDVVAASAPAPKKTFSHSSHPCRPHQPPAGPTLHDVSFAHGVAH